MDFDIEQVTENIYHDMTLMTFDFFPAINTSLFAGILGFNALRINNTVTGAGCAPGFLPMIAAIPNLNFNKNNKI